MFSRALRVENKKESDSYTTDRKGRSEEEWVGGKSCPRGQPFYRPSLWDDLDVSRRTTSVEPPGCLKIDRSRNSNKALHGSHMYDYRYIYLITINVRSPPETQGSRANVLAIGPTVSAEGV